MSSESLVKEKPIKIIKSLYMKQGSRFIPTTEDKLDIHKHLPNGIFVIKFSDFIGYYFEIAESFTLPSKCYGDILSKARRVFDTYSIRLKESKSTGLLLSGEKGSGKTLLAKVIAQQSNLPVILVNNAFHDDDFKATIASLGPSIVIFDEFEKVYAKQESQNELLTLFDGIYPTKSLYIVICNERFKLTDALRNRPGRLYYAFESNGVDNQFIKDYCEDKLTNKDYVNTVINISKLITCFTFDMLQTLIEEMNRFNEPAQTAIQYLNIKSDVFSNNDTYIVTAQYGGKELDIHKQYSIVKGSPLEKSSFTLYLVGGTTPAEKAWFTKNKIQGYTDVSRDNLTKIDPEQDIYHYQLDNGLFVTLTKKQYNASISQQGWESVAFTKPGPF